MESKYPVGKKTAEGVYRFKSKITGEYVMTHQWIAEVAVQRKAFKEKVALPYKYWNGKDKWAKEYKGQVTQAAKLLKKYHPQAIINAMTDVKWCWSLRTKQLLEAIKKHNNRIELTNKRIKDNPVAKVTTNTTFTKQKTKVKSKLGRLRDL
jgi:hypothetical protein